MGVLDQLEGGLSGGGAASGAQGQVMGAVLQLLQGQSGGIGGVLSSFEHASLGGVAQSWIHEGPNQPVSADQVSQALPGPVGDLASQLGVSHQEAAGHLAGVLPQLMDHLSPGGQVPADGGFGALGGLMSRFGGGAS